MDAKIEKGRALVLVGPQGCGTTMLARQLAEAQGPYREIDVKDLERDFQNWMESQIKTVICDGFPTRRAALERAKQYVTADRGVRCYTRSGSLAC